MATNPLLTSLAGVTDAEIGQLVSRLTPGARRRLLDAAHERTDKLLARPVSSFDAGPLLWLTKHTKTQNPNHEKQGLPYLSGFPRKSYFVPLFNWFLTEELLLIPKTRTMLTSWSAVGYATYRAQWCNWDCIIQSCSQDKVLEITDYAAQLWSNQPDWLRARYPLASKVPLTSELQFVSGGRVKAIPGGADKIRTFHPTLAIFDEFSYMEDAEQCWNAAKPACQQMIGIGTAHPGWMADQCCDPGAPLKIEPSQVRPQPYVTDRQGWER
jgi:hypothetical protein